MFSAFSVAQGYLTNYPHNAMCLSYHLVIYESLSKEKCDGPIFSAFSGDLGQSSTWKTITKVSLDTSRIGPQKVDNTLCGCYKAPNFLFRLKKPP